MPGFMATARRYSIHHKNALTWLEEDIDEVQVSKIYKRQNKKVEESSVIWKNLMMSFISGS